MTTFAQNRHDPTVTMNIFISVSFPTEHTTHVETCASADKAQELRLAHPSIVLELYAEAPEKALSSRSNQEVIEDLFLQMLQVMTASSF